jgi:hypothetical protein
MVMRVHTTHLVYAKLIQAGSSNSILFIEFHLNSIHLVPLRTPFLLLLLLLLLSTVPESVQTTRDDNFAARKLIL